GGGGGGEHAAVRSRVRVGRLGGGALGPRRVDGRAPHPPPHARREGEHRVDHPAHLGGGGSRGDPRVHRVHRAARTADHVDGGRPGPRGRRSAPHGGGGGARPGGDDPQPAVLGFGERPVGRVEDGGRAGAVGPCRGWTARASRLAGGASAGAGRPHGLGGKGSGQEGRAAGTAALPPRFCGGTTGAG